MIHASATANTQPTASSTTKLPAYDGALSSLEAQGGTLTERAPQCRTAALAKTASGGQATEVPTSHSEYAALMDPPVL
jgi:hypothetical protein